MKVREGLSEMMRKKRRDEKANEATCERKGRIFRP